MLGHSPETDMAGALGIRTILIGTSDDADIASFAEIVSTSCES